MGLFFPGFFSLLGWEKHSCQLSTPSADAEPQIWPNFRGLLGGEEEQR